MTILKIEETDSTPKVILNGKQNCISIEGVSRPEDAQVFYFPIKEWLDSYCVNLSDTPDAPLAVELRLSYFNSASVIELIEFFRRIKAISDAGKEIEIKWCYAIGDDLIEEVGQDIADVCELPFNYIEE